MNLEIVIVKQEYVFIDAEARLDVWQFLLLFFVVFYHHFSHFVVDISASFIEISQSHQNYFPAGKVT